MFYEPRVILMQGPLVREVFQSQPRMQSPCKLQFEKLSLQSIGIISHVHTVRYIEILMKILSKV